jgi:hypothetical protein
MGIFSALLGNAGAVNQETLIKDYGKLLIEGETIEFDFVSGDPTDLNLP